MGFVLLLEPILLGVTEWKSHAGVAFLQLPLKGISFLNN